MHCFWLDIIFEKNYTKYEEWGYVRWDEANLDEIEATKPVRKKIVEPKTPYHPMIEEDGSSSPALKSADCISYAAHAEAIASALTKAALSEKLSGQFGGWASSEDEADGREKEEGSVKERHDMNFEQNRRAHYDEFKKVKEMQKKVSFQDYSDEEGRCNLSPCVREIHIDSGDEILKTINICGN